MEFYSHRNTPDSSSDNAPSARHGLLSEAYRKEESSLEKLGNFVAAHPMEVAVCTAAAATLLLASRSLFRSITSTTCESFAASRVLTAETMMAHAGRLPVSALASLAERTALTQASETVGLGSLANVERKLGIEYYRTSGLVSLDPVRGLNTELKLAGLSSEAKLGAGYYKSSGLMSLDPLLGLNTEMKLGRLSSEAKLGAAYYQDYSLTSLDPVRGLQTEIKLGRLSSDAKLGAGYYENSCLMSLDPVRGLNTEIKLGRLSSEAKLGAGYYQH